MVSAPTSFGKTRVVQEIITHNSDYRVIGIVMPTVSLLSEQIVGLKFLEEEYVISKSSRVKIEEDKKYILVLTPERMANFLDENPSVNLIFLSWTRYIRLITNLKTVDLIFSLMFCIESQRQSQICI